MYEQELKRLQEHLSGGFANPCEAGHGVHHTKIVGLPNGEPFEIFDWTLYADTTGYCPADDAVSQSIDLGGGWEAHISEVANRVLQFGRPGVVLDIGAHVGWYASLAMRWGWPTLAVEANLDCCAVLERNLKFRPIVPVYIAHGWIGEKSLPFHDDLQIQLLKADIEGNELYVYQVFAEHFHKHSIEYAIFEISPVFNNSYPELIGNLLNDGYRGFRIDQAGKHDEWTRDTVEEKLLEHPQIDMVFVAPGNELP